MIKREEDITIYLSGPIDNCSYHETTAWREEVKRVWKGKILDPCRRTVDFNDYKGIVELDKIDIQQSDAILANCWKASWGTPMEIPFAWQMNKVVVVNWPQLARVSPWVRYHSHMVIQGSSDEIVKARHTETLNFVGLYDAVEAIRTLFRP